MNGRFEYADRAPHGKWSAFMRRYVEIRLDGEPYGTMTESIDRSWRIEIRVGRFKLRTIGPRFQSSEEAKAWLDGSNR